MRPQNKIISLSAAFLFATGFTANALDNDTLSLTPDTLGNSFTLELNNVQLTSEADSFSVLIRREYIGKDRKTYITFHSDKVVSNGEIIARNLPNDGRAHNYVFARRGITTTIFRDGIQFATTPSEVLTEIPISTSLRALPYEYSVIGISKLAAGCTADTLSTLEFIEPDEAQGETRIGEMLGGTNLVTDPYLNTGFNGEGLNAADRTFVTNAALLGGWGTEAEMSPASYSGPYCVRLSGQAFTNGNATTGASLTIPARLTSGTDYLVRAMVKTDGYEGRIYAGTGDSYIYIPDTQGEWKQIEGILTPTGAQTCLTVDNSDNESDGTLYIDNVEVYAETSFSRFATYLPFATLPAGTVSKYNYSGATAYLLDFTLDGDNSSQLDTTGLNYLGAARLTRSVEGSVLYPMYFPGDVQAVQITGSYDGRTFTNLPGVNGLDYIIYRQNGEVFEVCPTGEPVPAGCYLVQFVDNLADASVSIQTGRKKMQGFSEKDYNFVGNDAYKMFTPAGRFLRYDAAAGCFRLTEGEALEPFEAYIATSVSNPVDVYYPPLVTTGLQHIDSESGARMSVYATQGGISIYATRAEEIAIFRTDGALAGTVSLAEGENFYPLPSGIYIVKNTKVAVP